MPVIGIRELKARASEIVRDMRENKTSYTITYRGKPVGVLTPVAEDEKDSGAGADPWEEFLRLGREMGENLTSEKTLNEVLSEMRR